MKLAVGIYIGGTITKIRLVSEDGKYKKKTSQNIKVGKYRLEKARYNIHCITKW